MCRCFLSLLFNVQVALTNEYNFIILRFIIFESWQATRAEEGEVEICLIRFMFCLIGQELDQQL